MKQATSFSAPIPTEFSPEFTSWLNQEQSEARLHRSRMFKMTIATVVVGTVLFLLNGQPNWVQQIVEAATRINP